MRARFVLLLLLLPVLAVLAFGTAKADEFVTGTEDVPLMPGLAMIEGSALVFDKPEGRIVEAQARGAISRAKIQAFYAASLPQLGWKKAGNDQWRRDTERLKLDFHGEDGHLTVGFTLLPQ